MQREVRIRGFNLFDGFSNKKCFARLFVLSFVRVSFDSVSIDCGCESKVISF